MSSGGLRGLEHPPTLPDCNTFSRARSIFPRMRIRVRKWAEGREGKTLYAQTCQVFVAYIERKLISSKVTNDYILGKAVRVFFSKLEVVCALR